MPKDMPDIRYAHPDHEAFNKRFDKPEMKSEVDRPWRPAPDGPYLWWDFQRSDPARRRQLEGEIETREDLESRKSWFKEAPPQKPAEKTPAPDMKREFDRTDPRKRKEMDAKPLSRPKREQLSSWFKKAPKRASEPEKAPADNKNADYRDWVSKHEARAFEGAGKARAANEGRTITRDRQARSRSR